MTKTLEVHTGSGLCRITTYRLDGQMVKVRWKGNSLFVNGEECRYERVDNLSYRIYANR